VHRQSSPMFLKVSMGLGLATAAITSTMRADPGLLPPVPDVGVATAAPAYGLAPVAHTEPVRTGPAAAAESPRPQMSAGLRDAIHKSATGSIPIDQQVAAVTPAGRHALPVKQHDHHDHLLAAAHHGSGAAAASGLRAPRHLAV
jgi:hypothetical protein